MANEQFAFIDKSRVPSREEWQNAINQAGFDFELDPELKPFEDSGFLPCKLFGLEAGFEIYYEEASRVIEAPDELKALAGDRDYSISFRWGGSMIECASAMIASYALAKSFGAKVSYECDPPDSLEELLKQTLEIIEYAKKAS
jgi:hypothetical protein